MWGALVVGVLCAFTEVGARADPAPVVETPRSGKLRSGLSSPMPGGTVAGWQGDTGLDIMTPPRPVFAIAAGTLDYSEPGHTRWRGPRDTPNSVRIHLDEPIAWRSHKVTHIYYTHLSALETTQSESATVKKHVSAGEPLGVSGFANGSAHLHIGFLLDGNVEQDSWDTLLVEGDIRQILGAYRNGETLPRLVLPPAPSTPST